MIKTFIRYILYTLVFIVANNPLRSEGSAIIKLLNKTYCQDQGRANLDSCVMFPKTFVGFNYRWRCLKAPAGIFPSAVITKDSQLFRKTYWFNFGQPADTVYEGVYTFELWLQDITTGDFVTDTCRITIINEVPVRLGKQPVICFRSDSFDLHSLVTDPGSFPDQWLVWRGLKMNGKTAGTDLVGSDRYLRPRSDTGFAELELTYSYFGCPWRDTSRVYVRPLPPVKLTLPSVICDTVPAFLLKFGSPAGGYYTGRAVASNYFQPGLVADSGGFIRYTYTDSVGCTGTDTGTVKVKKCSPVIVSVEPAENPNMQIAFQGGKLVFQNTSGAWMQVECYGFSGQLFGSFQVLPGRQEKEWPYRGLFLFRWSNQRSSGWVKLPVPE